MNKRKSKTEVGRRQFYRRIEHNRKMILEEVRDARTDDVCSGIAPSNVIFSSVTIAHSNMLEIDKNKDVPLDAGLVKHNKHFDYFDNLLDSENNIDHDFFNINSLFNANLESNANCSNVNISFIDKLRHWASTTSVTHDSVTKLLHILSQYHSNLPLDCRTLLKTPTSMSTKKLSTGEYYHFGLMNNINKFLNKYPNLNGRSDSLKISFNVDGIPLYHSTNMQLWPILCQIKNTLPNFSNKPFPVAIFCGSSKPYPLEEYLKDLIEELKSALGNDYYFNGKCYSIEIHSFICDAPARAYMKCIKSHCGYSSCEKCVNTGIRIDGRVIFDTTPVVKRTDKSFRDEIDEDHHIGTSPLVQLPIGLVTQFPIDYMHNVCLGVVRKLLHTWIGGPLQVRMSSRVVKSMSDLLVSYKSFIPLEFNRKPRSLSELARWKATEFRTFLLYLGPVVLQNFSEIAVYENFLLLHSAITILISCRHLVRFGTQTAGTFLNNFIEHSKDIYGVTFLIYNVHMLSHLSDDVEEFGPLDNFSAFPFENYLASLKRLVKSTINPLREICNRIKEKENLQFDLEQESVVGTKFEHNSGPVLPSMTEYTMCKQFKKIILCSGITFAVYSYSKADSYCMIQGSVVEIHNIVERNKNHYIIGKRFCNNESLYTYPIHSKELNIIVITNLSKNYQMWPVKYILCKCVVLPCNKRLVSFPLIHSLI